MRIKVPATSANLGPGFDTLGLALAFYNKFEAHRADKLTVKLADATCVDTKHMPLEPDKNLMAKAYKRYFEYRDEKLIPAELIIEAHIPFARGLGSSSTAIAAGFYLADQMHPEPLGKEALVNWAIEMEGHPDNVVPALLGGVRCCLSNGQSILLEWPQNWGIVLVITQTPVKTKDARAIMPPHYQTSDVVETLRGMGSWMTAINSKNNELFKYALSSDRIHEPYRSQLIAEYKTVRELISKTDALGCVISGSGSTLAIFTSSISSRDEIKKMLASQLPDCKVMTATPDFSGTSLMN